MNRRRVRSVGGDSEIEEIRSAVQAAIESVAPEVDTPHLRSDAPLRRQIDLDSLDWLNVIAGLGERLSLEIPESDYERLGTLDSILADVASRQTERAGKPMRATAGAAADLLSTRYVVGGTPVTVRQIRADDAPLEADFVRLSQSTPATSDSLSW
ncbi:MAG TPA: acyl carrier protein [Burkholderiaceae bacterium]|nr:acyl carrier protein [Burkholderiaceae bacterium]